MSIRVWLLVPPPGSFPDSACIMEEMEVPSDVFLFMGDESEDGKRKGASRLPFGPRVYSVLFRYPLDVEFIPIRCPIRPISVIHILSSAPSFFSRPVQTYLSIVVTANFPLIDLWDFDGLETEAKAVSYTHLTLPTKRIV